MRSDWNLTTLGNILNLRRGHDLPKVKMKNGIYPVVGSSGVIGYHDEFTSSEPCVTVGRSGNSAGRVIITFAKSWAHNTTLYVDDFKGNDSKFIYYLLKTLNLRGYSGGSAVPTLNRNHIHPVKLFLPPISEQKKIAHILGTIDDKIELNRQTNETLEAMAQALFQSWFVDFDPVMDNAIEAGNPIPETLQVKAKNRKDVLASKQYPRLPKDICQQFPDRFLYDETLEKWIPDGWGVGTLKDLTFVKGGYAFKSKSFGEEGNPVVKIKNINADRTINVRDIQYTSTEPDSIKKEFWLESGDMLMAMTGATVGKFGFLVKKENKHYFLNQRVAKFFPLIEISETTWFTYCFFLDEKNFKAVVNLAEGSAQPNVSATEIMSLNTVIPSLELIRNFEETVSIYFDKIIKNILNNSQLTKTRNTLLPQLISGKLSVADLPINID